MDMNYCMHCGTKLTKRFLDTEGDTPYCPSCEEYRFPVFNTAVSMIVLNPSKDKILLIQQYGRPHNILVAGYINKGENAEHAAIREIGEEIGLDITSAHINRTQYFEPSNTLMINFTCIAATDDLSEINSEVDHAEWYSFEDAVNQIKENSLAKFFLVKYIDSLKQD